ncbi:DUF1616 domain-containing protein [Halovenus sp. WSH3]|uniref:DUF1616 domain-containing protein n=1 Tax=Halovenus carboxidivorans TaxID=2692199 RepID=A0A6B0T3W7_9EURY|nr:DUF1616 domain-containing protein [Halovenus carboxidivorans]MXR52978.1 DUF1616 domain-containing protein [Halovenus carboxidivorans]
MSYRGESESSFPIDLLAVGLLGLYTLGVAAGVVGDVPGRRPLGVAALLFAPGYALVCGLFPRERGQETITEVFEPTVGEDAGQITVIERLLLGVGMSLCLVPLLGLGLVFVGVGVQSAGMLGATGLTTVVLTVIAGVRRRQVLPWERFDPLPADLSRDSVRWSGELDLRTGLSVLLAIGFVVAGAGIGVAVLETDRGEQFTEFGLVTEDPETGELTADDYPDELTPTQSERIQVTVTNNEGRPVEYTVVTLVESLDSNGNRQQAERVDSFRVSVENGETVREQRSLDPEMSGTNLRLTYLLYVGSPPDEQTPATETAYRSVHLWVDVPTGGN